MKQSKEVEYCKKLFYNSGRKNILQIIEDSNLNDRERSIIHERYIKGMQVKEICDNFSIDENAYKKMHRRILCKLYNFLKTTL